MNAVVTDRPQAETEGKVSPIPSVTLDVSDLRKAVSTVAVALDPRSSIPILAMIGMMVDVDGKVTLRATDIDDQVTCTLKGEAAGPFEAAVSGRTLSKLLATLPAGEITLTPGDGWVSFVSGEMSGKIPSLPFDDMPKISPISCARPFEMPVGDLLRLLESVSHCISTEETRYYLNGIFLQRLEGKLFAVATNGHTLSQASLATPVDGNFPTLDAGVILSRKRIKPLLRHIAPLPEEALVTIQIPDEKAEAPHRISFSWSHGDHDMTMMLKLIDGTFPDYRKVLPQEFAGRFVVYRSFLRRAAHSLLSVLGEVRSPGGKPELGVKLHLDKNSLQVTGYHPTHGQLSTKVTIISHDAATLGFQARYIVDCMDAFQCEAMTVGYTDAGGPVLFEPADSGQLSDKQDRVSLTQCIMTMRV